MKILFTFPGQGAQTPDMLHQLPDTDITKQHLAIANEVLSEDALKLDTQQALQKTRAVQLCGLIAGVIYARLLQAQEVKADFVTGLSIGAFPAAVVAGALDFAEAIQLVSLRGRLMEQAYPQGFGLTSIQGLYQHQVEAIVKYVHSPEFPVYIANINDEDQFVIAGSEDAMFEVAKQADLIGARKITKLAVSVPSHCELLLDAAHKLAQAMKTITFRTPQIAYLSGSTARVIFQPEKIAYDLAYNMSRTVCWHEAMVAAYERGVRLAIEMPPGAVLTGLTKKVMVDGEAISVCQSGLKNVTVLAKSFI